MLITNKTKTRDVLAIVTTKELIDQLLEKVESYPLDKDILEMTIAEFADVINDEEAYITKLLNEEYALKAFGRLKNYREQMRTLVDWLKKLEVKQTPDEKQAAIGVDFPSLPERMLLTVTSFFHLNSFDEGEKVKLSNYLLIAKDQAADVKYQRNYQRILDQKAKMNKKKK